MAKTPYVGMADIHRTEEAISPEIVVPKKPGRSVTFQRPEQQGEANHE
jgi:hypothetical protein